MNHEKVLYAVFACSQTNNEPVKDWLKELSLNERKIIGFKIKEVEYGWPVGMPLTKSLGNGLWEVRVNLGETEKIARIIFGIDGNRMVLLHGFIKKTQKTPKEDLNIASKRWKSYKSVS
ncbi:type II toxin-antitoxin system RelE/ParE family toxin [Thioflexithrix psekupsensis]|uniref:Addiction module toxin RelE n=1 Tax=Thioflexithrix psekupsensis TaxID=1570016 RepID=A0A251X569_9GAMM|nr:type II toxin-antitoxin system RelE/ParE family toxin [Thioflexithrix psekupsensis]OUD12505.1 hypothetical protein TPSD3_15550 [Thioflexithrix psekupsensis]